MANSSTWRQLWTRCFYIDITRVTTTCRAVVTPAHAIADDVTTAASAISAHATRRAVNAIAYSVTETSMIAADDVSAVDVTVDVITDVGDGSVMAAV